MPKNLSRPLTRLSYLAAFLLLLAMIACQTETPSDDISGPTIESPSLVPQEIPMTTLLRNPASFEGQTIRVTGQYRSIPLLVCGDTIHRSPATWKLIFGDVETLAAGFDEALRPLAATGLSLTIEGRWQKWKGPVGCGRRAPAQEIWYLSASRIVSPNPLVKIDSDEGGGIVLLPSPTLILDPVEMTAAATTPDVEPSPPQEFPTESFTPTPSPTFQLIPTSLPGATAANTIAPTATSNSGGNATSTPNPTAAGGTAVTDTPTPTTGDGSPIDQGTLPADSVEPQTLTANGAHIWQINPASDGEIIITAGSSLDLDLSLTLLDAEGNEIDTADQGDQGEAEILFYEVSNPSEELQVVISSVSGAGDYIVMLFDGESEPVVSIQETIIYGSGGSGDIPAGTDEFWLFEGQSGDTITIEVSPIGSSGNIVFYLIGPDGSELEFIDETEVGESERLSTFTLPDSGLYAIGIGEASFEPVEYSMTLIQE